MPFHVHRGQASCWVVLFRAPWPNLTAANTGPPSGQCTDLLKARVEGREQGRTQFIVRKRITPNPCTTRTRPAETCAAKASAKKHRGQA